MREELIAWAEDCVVRGPVELPDGRLSDVVNATELLHVAPARVEALDDGRIIELDEFDLERRDIHFVLVRGRAGDPTRKLRTVREPVAIEVGPFVVHGNLHRPPSAPRLAAITLMAAKFVPVTEATYAVGTTGIPAHADVLLVNRELIARTNPLDSLPA